MYWVPQTWVTHCPCLQENPKLEEKIYCGGWDGVPYSAGQEESVSFCLRQLHSGPKFCQREVEGRHFLPFSAWAGDIRRDSPHPCNMGSCAGDEGLKVPVQHTRFSYPETRNRSAQTLFMLSLPFLSGFCIHLRDLIWGVVCTWTPRVNYRNIAQPTANLT